MKIKYILLLAPFMLNGCSHVDLNSDKTINPAKAQVLSKYGNDFMNFKLYCFSAEIKKDSSIYFGAPKGIIKSLDAYETMILKVPNKRMVRVSDNIPEIKIDLRYAHYENLFNKPIYSNDIAFLNIKACESLKKVQEEMLNEGYRLIIWDAYRPYSVTVLMWNIVKDARYAATPEKGSRHNRGMAVDVSFEKINGETLEMPTKFDECKRESSPLFNGISKEARKNRDYLINKMSKYGFKVLNSEWWHFDYKDCWSVPVMDVSFEELDK